MGNDFGPQWPAEGFWYNFHFSVGSLSAEGMVTLPSSKKFSVTNFEQLRHVHFESSASNLINYCFTLSLVIHTERPSNSAGIFVVPATFLTRGLGSTKKANNCLKIIKNVDGSSWWQYLPFMPHCPSPEVFHNPFS